MPGSVHRWYLRVATGRKKEHTVIPRPRATASASFWPRLRVPYCLSAGEISRKRPEFRRETTASGIRPNLHASNSIVHLSTSYFTLSNILFLFHPFLVTFQINVLVSVRCCSEVNLVDNAETRNFRGPLNKFEELLIETGSGWQTCRFHRRINS